MTGFFINLKRFATVSTVRKYRPTVAATLASMTDAELVGAAQALDELRHMVEAENARRAGKAA